MCILHSFSNHTATNGKDTAKRSNILKFNIVSDSDSFITITGWIFLLVDD